MTEKLNPIERALVAAAMMPAPKSRAILKLICEAGMTLNVPQLPDEPTEGQKHYAKREKFIKRTKGACDRVLKYAKHETLRNIERHFRAVPHAIESAEEPKTGLAARLTFKRSDFADELLAALREEALSALQVAGQAVFDELGRDDPWIMPGSDSIAFLDARANLLANVPDEVHAEIMQSIQDGLDHGESRRELMARIASKFDEISTGRAETIANTETSAAFNYARDKAMREAGVTHKRWLHSQSPDIKEPRPTHVEADGQVVPIDEPFDVGGVKFMMPADDSLGAGPEDIINCHCVSIPVEAPVKSGEGEGHPFRGNQYTTGETSVKIETEVERKKRLEEIRKRGNAMAERMGFPTDKIDYLETGEPVKFNVGDRQFVRGGFYSPSNGRITIDSTTITHPVAVDSMMAHEVSHAQFDTVQKARELEHARISTMLQNDKEFETKFTHAGFIRPEYRSWFAERFPASHAFARTFGDSYLNPESGDKMQSMIKEDGISDYSKAYWQKGAVDQYKGLWRATDETLAEVNSWAHTGAAHLSRPSRDWEQFARDVRVMYKRIKHPYQEIKSL